MLKKAFLLGFLASCTTLFCGSYDLTMIGQVSFRGSINRFPIAFAELFKHDLAINHIPTPGVYDFKDVKNTIINIIDNPDKSPGRVSLFFDDPWWNKKAITDWVPDGSTIKIAYSLLESTVVPARWVALLNKKFDLVIVADEYYRHVYKKSGVTVPLFVQPHGIYIEELLKEEMKTIPSHPFVFGCTAAFWPRKNQLLLIEAYHKEFGNDPNVRLKLHGRTGKNSSYFHKITKRLKKIHNPNIKILTKPLSDKNYKKFLKSLDCYVLVSKGEGFSITPREALALGKPTIISNNTAHKTLVNTGYVYGVPSEIYNKIDAGKFGNLGYRFNSELKDVQKALREVYTHYATYTKKAQQGREWVKQYRWKNLKKRFLNFIKPRKIVLGNENKVTDEYLMTNSEELYRKYEIISEGK